MTDSTNKPTRYYLCSDTQVGLFSAIYEAGLSRYGHRFVRILILPPNGCYDQKLFAEYIPVKEHYKKMQSVLRLIQDRLSYRVYHSVMSASASTFPDRGDVIYQFITYAFSMGDKVCDAMQLPFVKRMFEIQRRVQNEAHYLREFIRFREVQSSPPLLAATIEPTHHVLPMIMDHFCQRFAEEAFVILDYAHREAAFHTTKNNWVLKTLSEEETKQLYELCEQQEEYVGLWKTFFEHITIEERINRDLQRNMLPIHYRKHLTEFQE